MVMDERLCKPKENLFKRILFSKPSTLGMLIIIIFVFVLLRYNSDITGFASADNKEPLEIALALANKTISSAFNEAQTIRVQELEEKAAYYKAREELAWEELKQTKDVCTQEKEQLLQTIVVEKNDTEAKINETKIAYEEQLEQRRVETEAITTAIQNEVTFLKESYEHFVANTARSVCCKARVDNPAVSSYEISNDKLVCLENGEKQLSC